MAPRNAGANLPAGILGSGALKWILGFVLVFLAGAAVVTSALIVERQTALQRVSRYNLTWLLSQAAHETLRLQEVISAAAVPGSKIDRDDVALRVDVLGNRMNLLQGGEAAEFIRSRPGLVDTVETLRATLDSAQPLIDQLPDPASAIRLRNMLEPLVPRMLQLAAAANTRSGDVVAEDQRELSQLHWSLAGLLFAIMACAASLVWLIGWMRARLIRQLMQAKEAAETANATKSQFLANMSHELRTPLNGVLGMLEVMMQSKLTPDHQHYVAVAHQSGLLLLDLISSILDFSKIEAGRLELDEQPFDVRTLVEEVTEMLGAQARAKQLELTSTLAPDLPPLFLGDPVRVRQILINLVGNAIKFTQSGGVAVSVTQIHPGTDPQTLRFTVRDTGIGIPREKLDRIFEPFTQADLSNTRRFGGTGLGLTIARQLVELMGGDIGVDSREGQGSTFWFTIRLQVRHSHPDAPALGVAAPSADAAVLDGMSVLIASRATVDGRSLAECLSAWGVWSMTAEDWPSALEMLRRAEARRRPFDAMIADMTLPGIALPDPARVITADPALRNLGLIFAGHSERPEGLSGGIWVSAPMRTASLNAALHAIAEAYSTASSGGKTAELETVAPVAAAPPANWPVAVKALLVDDNRINAEIERLFLELAGCVVELAENGQIALERCERERYDIILMDTQMPEMDGREATRRIRGRETGRNRNTPIIGVSAGAQEAEKHECLTAGMNDYLTKPITVAQVSAMIEKWTQHGEPLSLQSSGKIVAVNDGTT